MSSVKKGLALIIANADYQSQPQLPSCHKDGTDMKAKLEQLNFDVLYYSNFAYRFYLCTLKIQYLAGIRLSKFYPLPYAA